MTDIKTKKKEWVKNVAIVFLIIMLILTFFSNTIMNRSLPQVTAKYMNAGNITYKVRGNGVIQSADLYHVKFNGSRIVESVEVRPGDFVEKGQVICYLSKQDSDELSNARIELEKARLVLKSVENKYMMQLLTGGLDTDVMKVGGKLAKTDTYIAQIKAANNEIEKATIELETQKEIVEVFEKKGHEVLKQIELTPENTADITQESKNVNDAKLRYDNAVLNVSQKSNVLEDIEREINLVKDNTPDGQEPDLSELKEKKNKAEKEKNKAISEKNDAEYALNAAQNNLNNKVAAGDTSAAVKKLKNQFLQINGELEKGKEVLEEKQKAYDDSYNELKNISSNISIAFGLANLQLEVDNARLDVKLKQEKVDKLSKQSDVTSIEAPVSGTITELMLKSGTEIPVDGIVATMQPEGKGYRLAVTVENDKAKHLNIGDRADIVNGWLVGNVEMVISSIVADNNNPNKNKVVNFDVFGYGVKVGQNISITVGQKNENYDMIVTNSAIHEDSGGRFIYTVRSKPSPLGTRYYAQRVDVNVLASDESKSAISGELSGNEFVITASNKPIADNEQIRMIE